LFESHSIVYKFNYYIMTILVFMFIFFSSLAGDEFKDQQYELEVSPQWYSTEHYVIQGSIGALRKKTETDVDRFYIRPSVSYSFNTNWSARAGLYSAYNNINKLTNNIEVRPYLGLNYYHTFVNIFEPISINIYLRAEERVRYDVESWDQVHNLRARLKVSGIYDFNDISVANTWRRAILSAEFLRTYFNEEEKEIHLDENFEVETRISLAIERILEDKQKIRFDLSWRYQVPFNEISDTNFNIFAFKISYFPVWGELFRNRLVKNVDE